MPSIIARGAPGGNRTPDALLRTEALYPLSYVGVCITKCPSTVNGLGREWYLCKCAWRGSNPRPTRPQPVALSTELQAHTTELLLYSLEGERVKMQSCIPILRQSSLTHSPLQELYSLVMNEPVLTTNIPNLRRFATGKVRDVYDMGDSLLLIASDRISAFDVIMRNGIPDKGRILTQMARFWFRFLRPQVATHLISCDIDYICSRIKAAGGNVSPELKAMLDGRATLGVKADAFPVECVVRGYLAGSLWKEYCLAGGRDKTVTLHGIRRVRPTPECA